MRKFILMVLTCIIGLVSCDKNRVYEVNAELSDKFWLADSTVTFDFEVKNTKTKYNLLYNIRNTIDYPYHNLYIRYSLKNSDGRQIAGKLVGQNLFDPVTGQPYGSGLGDVFDHQFKLLNNYKFSNVGKYQLELKQYMRMDTLPDILAVGYRLERVKQNE